MGGSREGIRDTSVQGFGPVGKWPLYDFGAEEMKINIGCGNKVLPGYVNIDRVKTAEDVLIVDLETASLPFEDASIEEVYADNVLEHIQNFIPLMNEIHRVLTVGGVLKVVVPVLPHLEAFQDPTHVRFFTPNSFEYFTETSYLWKDVGKNYGIVPFRFNTQKESGFLLAAGLMK